MIIIFLLVVSIPYCQELQHLAVERIPKFIPQQQNSRYQKKSDLSVSNSEIIPSHSIVSSSYSLSKRQPNSILEQQNNPTIDISLKSINSPCLRNVSQLGSGQYITIFDALAEPCSVTEDYEIALLDQFHYEYLNLDQNSSILIKGANNFLTSWGSQYMVGQVIINLIKCNLSLDNLNFFFRLQDNIISPNRYLIIAYINEQYSSLSIHHCHFQSVVCNIIDIQIFMVFMSNISKLEINSCEFIGVGSQQPSNISMVYISSCNNINLYKNIFRDTSISSTVNPISIFTVDHNSSLTIHECEFNKINSNNTRSISCLLIQGKKNFNLKIQGNKFKNCHGYENSTGTLEIVDANDDQISSEILVENNTFSNNSYYFTGGIFFASLSQFSKISFKINTFSFNENHQEDKFGFDACLRFYDSPEYWTKQTIIEKDIKEMFNGSKTNAGDNSVYYKVNKTGEDFIEGCITLTQLASDRLSKGAIIGIIIGSIIFVATVVSIAIILFILYKKKQEQIITSNFKIAQPLLRTSYRST